MKISQECMDLTEPELDVRCEAHEKDEYAYIHETDAQMLMEMQSELRDNFSKKTLAKKGLVGMNLADKILRKNGLHGILIGSLAKAILNPNASKDELSECNDVNVFICNDSFYFDRPFRFGIDWWYTNFGQIEYQNSWGKYLNEFLVWKQNSNGTVLSYDLNMFKLFEDRMEPGLYLLGKEYYLDIALGEMIFNFEDGVSLCDSIGRLNIDPNDKLISVVRKEFFEYRELLAEELSDTFPDYIMENFGSRVISLENGFNETNVTIAGVYPYQRRAIEKYIKKTPEPWNLGERS